jgi:hypothetical protein
MQRERDDREEHRDRERLLRRSHRQDAEGLNHDRPVPQRCRGKEAEHRGAQKQQPGYPQALHVVVRGRGPGQDDAGKDHEDHGEPGEEAGLGPIDRLQPSPEPEVARCRQEAGNISTEGLDLVGPATKAVRALVLEIAIRDRHEGRDGEAPGQQQPSKICPADASHGKPQQPQANQHRQIEKIVPAGERLQIPRAGKEPEIPPPGLLNEQVQPEQRERHPVARKHLDV